MAQADTLLLKVFLIIEVLVMFPELWKEKLQPTTNKNNEEAWTNSILFTNVWEFTDKMIKEEQLSQDGCLQGNI